MLSLVRSLSLSHTHTHTHTHKSESILHARLLNKGMNEFLDIVTLTFHLIFLKKVLSPIYRGRKGAPKDYDNLVRSQMLVLTHTNDILYSKLFCYDSVFCLPNRKSGLHTDYTQNSQRQSSYWGYFHAETFDNLFLKVTRPGLETDQMPQRSKQIN